MFNFTATKGGQAPERRSRVVIQFTVLDRVMLEILPLWHWPLHCQDLLPSCLTKALALGDMAFISIDALFFVMNT